MDAALRQLSSSSIAALTKQDGASLHQAVAAVLRWMGDVVRSGGDALVRAAAAEVLLRGMKAMELLHVTTKDKVSAMAVVRGWMSDLTEEELRVMRHQSSDSPDGWLLLVNVHDATSVSASA